MAATVTPENTSSPLPDEKIEEEMQKCIREKSILSKKINELVLDKCEHKLVLEAFENVPNDRKCYRMVGGVLVERTVSEVHPALEEHKRKVEMALKTLNKELDTLTDKHYSLLSNFIKKDAKLQNMPTMVEELKKLEEERRRRRDRSEDEDNDTKSSESDKTT